MSTFTHCPHCSVWYRIGPETLAQAEGLVRCGRCGEVFDARTTLWTGTPSPAVPSPTEAAGGSTTAAPEGSPAPEPSPAEPDPLEASPGPRLGRLEDLDLEEAFAPASPAAGPEDDPFAAVEDPFTIPPLDPIARLPAPRARPRRGRRPGWLLANGLLALLLAGSLVYLHPWGRSPPVAGALPRGKTGAPNLARTSHPRAFRITAAEVVPSRRHPRTALVVAGTILNTTARKAALPWLLVRLTDVAGRTVATGAFAPDRYAPPGRAVLRGRTAVPFRLRVLAPVHAAAGFHIDLCRGRPLRLSCT